MRKSLKWLRGGADNEKEFQVIEGENAAHIQLENASVSPVGLTRDTNFRKTLLTCVVAITVEAFSGYVQSTQMLGKCYDLKIRALCKTRPFLLDKPVTAYFDVSCCLKTGWLKSVPDVAPRQPQAIAANDSFTQSGAVPAARRAPLHLFIIAKCSFNRNWICSLATEC